LPVAISTSSGTMVVRDGTRIGRITRNKAREAP
jgi:hypothetical protein